MEGSEPSFELGLSIIKMYHRFYGCQGWGKGRQGDFVLANNP